MLLFRPSTQQTQSGFTWASSSGPRTTKPFPQANHPAVHIYNVIYPEKWADTNSLHIQVYYSFFNVQQLWVGCRVAGKALTSLSGQASSSFQVCFLLNAPCPAFPFPCLQIWNKSRKKAAAFQVWTVFFLKSVFHNKSRLKSHSVVSPHTEWVSLTMIP